MAEVAVLAAAMLGCAMYMSSDLLRIARALEALKRELHDLGKCGGEKDAERCKYFEPPF